MVQSPEKFDWSIDQSAFSVIVHASLKAYWTCQIKKLIDDKRNWNEKNYICKAMYHLTLSFYCNW